MRENVFRAPAGEIEPGADGEERETGGGEFLAALARQHGVELLLDGMEIEHVVGSVRDLRLGQGLGAPVGELLLLGDVLAEQVLGEVLEAVLVGVGAGELGGDLGAIERLRHHAEPLGEHADVEAREVKDLQP